MKTARNIAGIAACALTLAYGAVACGGARNRLYTPKGPPPEYEEPEATALDAGDAARMQPDASRD